jgi:cell division protein ZapA
MENKVDVVIGGEIITLRSGEQPDYLQRLARYADQKIDEIKAKSVTAAIDDRAKTLLIALNIADDYHKAMDRFQRLDTAHKALVAEMGKLQDENKGVKAKLKAVEDELAKMEKELSKTKKELDAFIKSFDAKEVPEGENILTLPKPASIAQRKVVGGR